MPEKIAPRTCRFTIGADTPGGEYGILPPGAAGVGSLGKVYTFAISEQPGRRCGLGCDSVQP